jgi:hypothetical protein
MEQHYFTEIKEQLACVLGGRKYSTFSIAAVTQQTVVIFGTGSSLSC